MPPPRSTRDVQLNRNRVFDRRISVPQARVNAREGFVRAAPNSAAPRAGARVRVVRPQRATAARARRRGAVARLRDNLRERRANRAANRARRARNRANRLRARG